MRFRGWAGKPPLKPPLPPARPPPAPPPPRLSLPTSAAPFSSPPPPPAVQLARQQAEHRFVRPVPRPPPQPPLPASTAHDELSTLLHELPPIAGDPLQPHLRLRPDDEIRRELGQWRTACWRAHALLAGPLQEDRREFRNKVVRVVAHTMRLLARVRMYSAAWELERAFFTKDDRPKRKGRGGRARKGEAGGGVGRSSSLSRQQVYGKGLGLKRGNINIAWMQSLGLRLEPGVYEGTKAFGAALQQLRKEQAGEGGINPHIIAFLLRKAELLEWKLQEDGMRPGEAKRQVQRLLEGIRENERLGQADVVRLALMETTLQKMEKDIKGKGKTSRNVYLQLKTDVRALVGEMEDLEGEEMEALHDVLASPSSSERIREEREILDLRAQTLHLAIRFLLLDAHHAPHLPPDMALALYRRSIAAACKVYANLLDLLDIVASSPAELIRIRQRQSSALFRIIWASVGIVDFGSLAVRIDSPPLHQEESVPPLDTPSVQQLLGSLNLTLSTVSHPPAFNAPPTPLGISTRFWRRLVYILTLPSAPSRRAPPAPPAIRPPWPLLQTTLETILAFRQHDASLLSSIPSPPPSTASPPPSVPVHSQALFLRTSFLIHLVRAVLLGGSPSTSSSPSSSTMNEGTPQERLIFLLAWIARMERTTISRVEGGIGREVLRRSVVRNAVEEVVKREWEGFAWQERREQLVRIVREWEEGSLGGEEQSDVESTSTPIDSLNTSSDASAIPVILSPPLPRKKERWHS
ncbi:hypothetical protein BCR35DRAFT_308196 [Leucosporidium creatinivorum]|uniref:Uncharacterized protein n=1 Tax=Leucosporidium creatinivorum TaxID=106004 RepID=A0A1Y2ECN4_9BASI|nr:hypothetical protein BCR35DRAFT_308196 [Leucosporidium creatinivorum]